MGRFQSVDEVDMFYNMITANTLTDQGPQGTCVEYQAGSTSTSTRTNNYVQTSRKINGRTIHSRIHQVALLKKIRLTAIPEGLEASHLCHNKRCMKISHLSAEPHFINMSRNTCAYMRETTGDRGYCTGDHQGYENCI